VTAVEQLGAYHVIRALDAGGPQDPQPGQFYMLSTAERWGGGADERPYLPRAFSYARAREGELSFLLEVVGPGTARLAELHAGEGLALIGPLGVGWRAPREGARRYLPLQDDIASTAFFYAAASSTRRPALPDVDGLEVI